MTALANAALLLAALLSWRVGARPVAWALAVVVVAAALSTLPIPSRVAYAIYLIAPAASAWLALRVATGREWPAVVAWLALAAWTWRAPPGAPWDAVRTGAGYLGASVQLGAVALLPRPLSSAARAVVVLLVGDIAAMLTPGSWPWWVTQGQSVLVAAALLWTCRPRSPLTVL